MMVPHFNRRHSCFGRVTALPPTAARRWQGCRWVFRGLWEAGWGSFSLWNPLSILFQRPTSNYGHSASFWCKERVAHRYTTASLSNVALGQKPPPFRSPPRLIICRVVSSSTSIVIFLLSAVCSFFSFLGTLFSVFICLTEHPQRVEHASVNVYFEAIAHTFRLITVCLHHSSADTGNGSKCAGGETRFGWWLERAGSGTGWDSGWHLSMHKPVYPAVFLHRTTMLLD